jgi:hypothetical protein
VSRRAGLQCGGKARSGTNDANLSGHFHFAEKLFADRLHVEINAAGRFGNEFDCAELQSLESAGRAFFRFGADDDDGARIGGHDLRGSLQTVHVRHVDVHRDDIGLKRFGKCHGFAAILGVTGDLELRIGVENSLKDFAHKGRVVDDEHARFV